MKPTLKKNEIVRNKKDIEAIINSKTFFYTENLQLKIVLKTTIDDSKKPPKILFIVSKKKFRRAVDRNKIKRILKAAWQQNKNESMLSVSLFALIYKPSVRAHFQVIKTEIETLINKISQIQPSVESEALNNI